MRKFCGHRSRFMATTETQCELQLPNSTSFYLSSVKIRISSVLLPERGSGRFRSGSQKAVTSESVHANRAFSWPECAPKACLSIHRSQSCSFNKPQIPHLRTSCRFAFVNREIQKLLQSLAIGHTNRKAVAQRPEALRRGYKGPKFFQFISHFFSETVDKHSYWTEHRESDVANLIQSSPARASHYNGKTRASLSCNI